MTPTTVSTTIGGAELTIETGRLAKQANGSVLITYGETSVLACATMGGAREGIDFFPLTVDFELRTYAAGKIPVTFFRREGRPGDKSVLTARMTDRPLRPLFPKGMRNEIQIVVTTLSIDEVNSPDVLCPLGASVALHISDIPFAGPVGSVRVGWVDGEPVVNPTYEQMAESRLDLMIAGTADAIMMVEAGAAELPSDDVLSALEAGHDAIKLQCELQDQLRALIGKEKTEPIIGLEDDELKGKVRQLMSAPWREALGQPGKAAHYDALSRITKEITTTLAAEEANAGREKEIKGYCQDVEAEVIRRMIIDEGVRADGRDTKTVRPLTIEVGAVPRVHGSGLFTRGETQVLSITTLGTIGDRKSVDWLNEQYQMRYFHQYNFPPYSVGETKRMGSPGRREIGHGFLAERALVAVLPSEEEFPYTIRQVSEVLESNGSSSMASVCGSTLSLLDAGVPLKRPVSGVAMGLLQEGDKFVILTDILGLEDHCGDMDFKVCGTAEGITALQMDIKCTGLTREIMSTALAQAGDALNHIRNAMTEVISEPREEISEHAPLIEVVQIDPEKIGVVVGPGGKMIKQIQAETGARIDIEQDGRVFIAAPQRDMGKMAADWVRNLTREVKVGEEYAGHVSRIFGFGAMVEILPGKEGLVHISKLAAERIARVEDAVSLGDELRVRVTEIDHQGRINLERLDIPIIVNLGGDEEGGEGGERNPEPRDRGNDRGGDRGGRGGGGGRGGDRGGRGGGGRGGDRGGRGGGGGGGYDRGPRRDDRPRDDRPRDDRPRDDRPRDDRPRDDRPRDDRPRDDQPRDDRPRDDRPRDDRPRDDRPRDDRPPRRDESPAGGDGFGYGDEERPRPRGSRDDQE